MKKTFSFEDKKIAPARKVEAIKHEVKKYIAREKRKPKPYGVDFWEFDCKFGFTEESAQPIKFVDIRSCITRAFDEKKESFYLEILSKAGHKPKKPPVQTEEIQESQQSKIVTEPSNSSPSDLNQNSSTTTL